MDDFQLTKTDTDIFTGLFFLFFLYLILRDKRPRLAPVLTATEIIVPETKEDISAEKESAREPLPEKQILETEIKTTETGT